jgi:hypothetical protein
MYPQQRAFKSISRTYSSSSFILSSELFKNANCQRCHSLSQRIPMVLDTKYTSAHSNTISYSTDSSKSTSTGFGKEDKQQQNAGVGVGGEADGEERPRHRDAEKEPLPEWPEGVNPNTGEKGGPKGPEPTRYGDWERKGRVSDF